MSDEYISQLELENQLLREELREQWEYNHSEHCTNEWPHPEGGRCHWPLPDVLATTEPNDEEPPAVAGGPHRIRRHDGSRRY